jgi:hypothetical protein
MARLRKEAAGKKVMGSSSAGRTRRKATAGRPVRRPVDISSGSGLILGLTALSLRLRRMPMTPVMKSKFPRSCSNFLSFFSPFC